MTYALLKTKLLTDLTDFLDNGFKQKLVKAVRDSVLPELQTLVLDLHQKAQEAREGVWIHEREMMRKDIDRKASGLGDRIGTLEMYMPQVRILGDAVKSLQVGHAQQQIATTRLETVTNQLAKVTDALNGRLTDQHDRVNDLEDRPGKKALLDRDRLKGILITGGVSLVVGTGVGILLAVLL